MERITFIMGQRIYHIGISGGKDSTALLLWMVRESGLPLTQMVASFCDTQNEAPETYAHVQMLSQEVFPIQWLETEGFLALARRKQRFPSTKARFCTQQLKLLPTKAFLESLANKYTHVVPVSGVRRAESAERSKLSEWGAPEESYFGMAEWRPLVHWSLADVMAIHTRHNIPLNPLYRLGATRVGCFPCINSNKREMRMLGDKFPERVEQIRQWEEDLQSTFFAPNKVPSRFRSKSITTKDGRPMRVCSIDDVIAWAQTGWRGRGTAPDMSGLFQFELDTMEPVLCLSQYQACE